MNLIRNRRVVRTIIHVCFLWLVSAAILEGQENPTSPLSGLKQKANPEQETTIRIAVDEFHALSPPF